MSFTIHENDKLLIRTSPGGRLYSRLADGKYRYNSFVLGGCGGGSATPQTIAEFLWKFHRGDLDKPPSSLTLSSFEALRQLLRELGWTDVLAEFDRFTKGDLK
jgi:hypothetical protein